MATIYKIKIKTVSPWVNYNEDYMKKLFEKFINELSQFDNIEIEVKRVS